MEKLATVLEQRPDNLIALMFLGRTNYFFAWFFDFLDYATPARQHLQHASGLVGEPPKPLVMAGSRQLWSSSTRPMRSSRPRTSPSNRPTSSSESGPRRARF